jgi:hypothetical protein
MSLIRAQLLKDICFDMSFHRKTKWIETAALTRMFDLCEQFEVEFEGKIETDLEIRACYGQILSRISNIAAQAVNPNISTRSISLGQIDESSDAEISKRFSSSSSIEVDAPPEGFKAAPKDLIELVVEKLPVLKNRAEPFLFLESTYSARKDFLDCYRDVLGSRYWAKRDDEDEGGFWPSARSETELAELIAFRDSLDDRFGDVITSDNVAAICALLIATTYAEWDTNDPIYHRFSNRVATSLEGISSIPPDQAGRIVFYYSNFLLGVFYPEKPEDDDEQAIAAVESADRTLGHILESVELSLLGTYELSQKYFDSIFAMINRRCSSNIESFRRFPLDLAVKALKQAERSEAQFKISADILLGISTLLVVLPNKSEEWSDTERLVHKLAMDTIREKIDNGQLEGDDFRRPGFGNLGFLIWNWIMRNGSERLCLDDDRVGALIALFERYIGERARNIIVAYVLQVDVENWLSTPVSTLADYVSELRAAERETPKLAEATLTLWGQQLLANGTEKVLKEVIAHLPERREAIDAKNIKDTTLAYRGIVLLASGFASTEILLSEFADKLRPQALLGNTYAAELYRAGQSRNTASAITKDYNSALIAATSALARVDILNGGDPASWIANEDDAKKEQS